jgi:uncharacterized protein
MSITLDEVRLLDTIRQRIVHQFRPSRLILFGSRARGDASPDSDVDLLVVLDELKDKRAQALAIREALSDLTIGIDVLVTSPEEIARRGNIVGTVLRPALREGRVLFERD